MKKSKKNNGNNNKMIMVVVAATVMIKMTMSVRLKTIMMQRAPVLLYVWWRCSR